MRLTLLLVLLSSTAIAGGSVEGTLTVKGDGKRTFVKNALVYISGYDAPIPKKPVKMAQTGRAFDKVVLPVIKGGKVTFANEEPLESIYHHVFSPNDPVFQSTKFKPNKNPFTTYALTTEGPVTVFCDIHKEMISTVYVVPNDRYVLLSEAEGASAPFKIDGIEPGKLKLVAWHRSAQKPIEIPIEIKEGQTLKIDLILEANSGVEQKLKDHKRREEGRGYQQKPDGGWMGEAIGSDEKWK